MLPFTNLYIPLLAATHNVLFSLSEMQFTRMSSGLIPLIFESCLEEGFNKYKPFEKVVIAIEFFKIDMLEMVRLVFNFSNLLRFCVKNKASFVAIIS